MEYVQGFLYRSDLSTEFVNTAFGEDHLLHPLKTPVLKSLAELQTQSVQYASQAQTTFER
ncbi:MAG: hypothetical protein ACLFR0_01050 [Alphaproteobacteria bacterium]